VVQRHCAGDPLLVSKLDILRSFVVPHPSSRRGRRRNGNYRLLDSLRWCRRVRVGVHRRRLHRGRDVSVPHGSRNGGGRVRDTPYSCAHRAKECGCLLLTFTVMVMVVMMVMVVVVMLLDFVRRVIIHCRHCFCLFRSFHRFLPLPVIPL